MPTANLSNRIDSALDRYQCCLKRKDACFRSLRDDEINDLRRLYGDLNDAYQAQAWGYFANILGSFCKIVSASFDPADGMGRALAGIASTFEGISGFKIKLDEGSITKIQGLLEQARTHMQNTEKENDELKQMLLHIERMLDEAKSKAERNISSPFTSN